MQTLVRRHRRASGIDATAYDGFISYSHAADGELAPALQRGLQRFAKPWYRMRALRIFRDETTLSATPHLWGSVREALDSSRYFILLASPLAADSPWVAREVSHWCDTKPVDHLLIGLTEGELVWEAPAGDFDWSATTAVPEALAGRLTEEPRYIDLRWARSASDLSLSHPRFRDAVAEFAAPMHGRAKDEIASQEVREHRRTLRVARAAVAVLAALTAVAIVAGIIALLERNTALARQRAAEASALTAGSAANLSSRFDRAALLSVAGYRLQQTTTARNSVLTALEQPTTAILRGHHGSVEGVSFDPADPDLLASAGSDGTVRFWSVEGRRELGAPIDVIGHLRGYAFHPTRESGQATALAFTPDGRRLVVASADVRYSPGGVAVAGETSTIHVLAPAGGRQLTAWTLANQIVEWLAVSPDGRLLATASDNGSVHLFDLPTGRLLGVPAAPAAAPAPAGVAFSADGTLLAWATNSGARLWNLRLGRPARVQLAGSSPVLGSPAFSRDGHTIAVLGFGGELQIFDLASGRLLSSFLTSYAAPPGAVLFSPSGTEVALPSGSDGTPGQLLGVGSAGGLGPVEQLSGSDVRALGASYSGDGSLLATADDDGTVRVFAADGLPALAHALPASRGAMTVAAGGSVIAAAGSGWLERWDARTGAGTPLAAPSSFVSALAVDARARLLAAGETGTVALLDTGSGRPVAPPVRLPVQSQVSGLAFAPSGGLLAIADGDPALYLYDLRGRRLVAPLHGTTPWAVAFSPDGHWLAAGGNDNRVVVWAMPSRRRMAVLRTGGPVRALGFSPDGSLLATASNDGIGRVWSIPSGSQVARLGSDSSGDVQGAAFSPDGSAVAETVGCSLQLWDPRTGASLGPVIDLHHMEANYGANCGVTASLAFTASGALVAGFGPNGPPVFLFSPLLTSRNDSALDTQVCAVVGRDLTRAEFRAAAPGAPYTPVCR